MFQLSVYVLLTLLVTFHAAQAYVPALPTNDTTAVQNSMNTTQASRLHLQWYSNGSYWEDVSYQLVGADSTGISQGALVHISETFMSNLTLPAATPWIALVSCDFNSTNSSGVEDIFTLARDKGAVSALLYSSYSQTCVINPEYADPTTFDQVLDIFSTSSLISAHLIEYQFGQVGTPNESLYSSYDSRLLNQSLTVVNESISAGNPVAPGYLIATLQAFNATSNTTNANENAQTSSSPNSNSSSTVTGLAMIILYAITGCVSALFCVVIISGAIRAIRHPDRYGPRVAIHGGVATGQSRARGLTRAILDTFPVVKFGSFSEAGGTGSSGPNKDPEAHSGSNNTAIDRSVTAQELQSWSTDDSYAGKNVERPISMMVCSPGGEAVADEEHEDGRNSCEPGSGRMVDDARPSSSDRADPPRWHANDNGEGPSQPSPVHRPSLEHKDVIPDAIGRETCPICITDFEEGDDLRLLPCEGNHRFHQRCVDPWLLELSSSCPICRQDFLALETMLWGESSEVGLWYPPNDVRRMSGPAQGNRFSRYLRSARRRNRLQEEHSTTNTSHSGRAETA